MTMAHLDEIIKAKHEAVEALREALSKASSASTKGGPQTAQDAVMFIDVWLSAMGSVVEVTGLQTFGPNCGACNKPGGTIQVNPYIEEIEGRTVEMRLHDACRDELAADI